MTFPFHAGKIFVFGANLKGIHGAGAAKEAFQRYGAKWGAGIGHFGQSYAIPTKDFQLAVMSLTSIRSHVDVFKDYARLHAAKPQPKQFFITAIGTGLAGYSHTEIAPMFANCPPNCQLPDEWRGLLK